MLFKMEIPEKHRVACVQQTQLILNSYKHWLKQDLIFRSGDFEEEARLLYAAPFALASGGAQEDQLLNYGNLTAQKLWELEFSTFCGTPSRLTAEPMHRVAREQFLKQVREYGFIKNYEGIRISSTGRRFIIKQAVVWNILDGDGCYRGQAATFSCWTYL